MNDAAKKVIRILANKGVDLNKVATTLAIVSPELFLEIVNKGEEADLSSVVLVATTSVPPIPSVPFDKLAFDPDHAVADAERAATCAAIAGRLVEGDIIGAMHYAHVELNLGLREAKDLVDAVDYIRVRHPDFYSAPKRYDGFVDAARHNPIPIYNGVIAGMILDHLRKPYTS